MERVSYATVGQFERTAVNAQTLDTNDAIEALRILEAATAEIIGYCGRTFHPVTETRTLNARGGRVLDLGGDVIAGTIAISVDTDGDGVYELDLVEGTDYVLLSDDEDNPTAAPLSLAVIPEWGSPLISAWPKRSLSVSVIADWGYSARYEAVRDGYPDYTPITVTINNSADAMGMSLAATPRMSAGSILRLEDERLYVIHPEAEELDVLLVTRGAYGTTAADHAAAPLLQFIPEPVVTEATLLQCRRLWKRKGLAIMPQAQAPGLGAERLIDGLDEDVKFALRSVRKIRG